jgi:DNA-directed RNA polymerase specialized sigma24 family protein
VRRDLVEKARGGDRAAFAALASAAVPRLFNVAVLMLRDRDLADDAVQETLVLAWRDLRGLRDLDGFDAWLHRVLVRCVYREADRERRKSVRVLSAGRLEPGRALIVDIEAPTDAAWTALLPTAVPIVESFSFAR